MEKLRIGVLISGNGSNLQALIDAASHQDYPATIAVVIANRPDAYGLTRAKEAGIPALTLSHKDYEGRGPFERALTDALEAQGVELVCLAGFMRLLTAGFVTRWHNRLINIHPSLLPAYKGLDTHARALEAGEKEAGCTVHFVRAGLDDGPIILQARVPVEPGDTPETLAKRVLTQEHRLYPEAVRALAEGRVNVIDETVLLTI
jgi:phosphoribosylglycinamide formyltransferase-1